MDTNIGLIVLPPESAGISEEVPGVTYLLGKHYFTVIPYSCLKNSCFHFMIGVSI